MITKIEFRASIAPIMSGIRTGGDGLRLTLDVPESDVSDAVALIALRNCPLKITVEVDNSPVATRITEREGDKPKREPKEKQSKGEWGRFWELMFHKRFLIDPGLNHILEELKQMGDFDDYDDKDVLYGAFNVTSMSAVSPADFKRWLRDMSQRYTAPVDNVITMIEEAERQIS